MCMVYYQVVPVMCFMWVPSQGDLAGNSVADILLKNLLYS